MERDAAYEMERTRRIRSSSSRLTSQNGKSWRSLIDLPLPNPGALLSSPETPLSPAKFPSSIERDEKERREERREERKEERKENTKSDSIVRKYMATPKWTYEGGSGRNTREEKRKEGSGVTTSRVLTRFVAPAGGSSSKNTSLVLHRPMMTMGPHDVAKAREQRRDMSKLLQPMLDGATFQVRHGKEPLACTFSLHQDMSMLKWVAAAPGISGDRTRSSSSSKTSSVLGGNIRIAQIVSVHRNLFDSRGMELKMMRGEGDNSSTVVLRLLAASDEQCVIWMKGLYYLRGICPEKFF